MASANSPEKDYYAVLDVTPDADMQLIKKNYRSLVQRFHPDRFQSPYESEAATSKMIEINEAFAVLSDEKARAEYDARRLGPPAPPPAPEPVKWEPPARMTREAQPIPKNAALDQALSQELLQKLKLLIAQAGAPMALREEPEKSWLWSFLSKRWNKNYWIGLRRLAVLNANTMREILTQMTALIVRHRSVYKTNSFVFILAVDSIADADNVLKLCRSFCTPEGGGGKDQVNILLLELKSKSSMLCGKKAKDPILQMLLSKLPAP